MAENTKYSYDANGVKFTIYRTNKRTASGPRTYWLLIDFSIGKRRTFNNPSKKAAEHRADQIRAAMVNGQAHRMSLNNGQWQDVCIALEVLRSSQTCESLGSVVRSWAECIAMLGGRAKHQLIGRNGGRKPIAVDDPRVQTAKKMPGDKTMAVADICRTLRISRATLYRYLAMK